MELQKDVLDKLIKYLISHGYPEESFAVEYGIGNYRADLVIIDVKTKEPMMLFEIKTIKNKNSLDLGEKQIRKFLDVMGTETIPTYLVFSSEKEPFFSVERVYVENSNDTTEKKITDFNYLNYNYQRKSRLSEKIQKNYDKKKNVVDIFKWFCWISAFLLLIILVLKQINLITVDNVDFAILGAIVGLVIIPFANRLKILGMEFERFTKDE